MYEHLPFVGIEDPVFVDAKLQIFLRLVVVITIA
jgi:hypothetical protein